jgi:hypothetical protein
MLQPIRPHGLVFWEAKHFRNGELRSAGDTPPVVDQIAKYEAYLREHGESVLKSYQRVAENLVEISKMGWRRKLDPMIASVAAVKQKLTLATDPKVGLIIFGFDQAQRTMRGGKSISRSSRKTIRFASSPKGTPKTLVFNDGSKT